VAALDERNHALRTTDREREIKLSPTPPAPQRANYPPDTLIVHSAMVVGAA
jgi:hypothetical protein